MTRCFENILDKTVSFYAEAECRTCGETDEPEGRGHWGQCESKQMRYFESRRKGKVIFQLVP